MGSHDYLLQRQHLVAMGHPLPPHDQGEHGKKVQPWSVGKCFSLYQSFLISRFRV